MVKIEYNFYVKIKLLVSVQRYSVDNYQTKN